MIKAITIGVIFLLNLAVYQITFAGPPEAVEEAAFTTGLSNSLVKEYADLIEELGLTDDELPSIMTALVRTAQAPPDTRDTSVPVPESTTVMQ